MRFGHIFSTLFCLATATSSLPTSQASLLDCIAGSRNVSVTLFAELEELSRIVDISYCVGMTGLGISKPFQCLSRCSEFKNFELVTTWNTGPLLSDSCGYIALSHPPSAPRIIMAFRGTYSVANTIADLSTMPQEYIPYPGGGKNKDGHSVKCTSCTVHTGFYTSWLHTRKEVLPDLAQAMKSYPTYELTLVGHSLGGAVAALAALDFNARGWEPKVTTFGEPRVGNKALMQYIDAVFDLLGNSTDADLNKLRYRRVTHAGDPVPLLPLEEWGYSMHAGEVFISKSGLPPSVADLEHCDGDADPACIAYKESSSETAPVLSSVTSKGINVAYAELMNRLRTEDEAAWSIPDRYKLWQLFFAHRDYFWRLGLCVPGGDPKDWYRKYLHSHDGNEL